MRPLRIAIGALLVFAVMAHGGVEEWALAVLETGAASLFLLWAIFFVLHGENEVVIPAIFPPLSAFCFIVVAQWFFHATVSPYSTRVEVQLLLADLILVFLAAQAFRTAQDWRGFFWFVMVFAFFVCGFGILQHLTFNGKLYWFREMRYGGIPFGPYVNRNHFAGFAELAIPVALVPLILGKVRREKLFAIGLFALLPIGALLLSASRGGIVALGVEILFLLFFVLLRRAGGRHLLAGGVVLVAALAMVSWLGVRQILSRFDSFQTLEANEGKRASMRHGTWQIFLDHPILGTGLGTLQLVYPRYETLYDGKIVNHAHNDYLEALAETGIVGGFCCAWFVGVLLLAGLRILQQTNQSPAVAFHLAGLTACCGFFVHSLVDFNLHIPANALFFFLMALLATAEISPRQSGSTTPARVRSPRNR